MRCNTAACSFYGAFAVSRCGRSVHGHFATGRPSMLYRLAGRASAVGFYSCFAAGAAGFMQCRGNFGICIDYSRHIACPIAYCIKITVFQAIRINLPNSSWIFYAAERSGGVLH